MNVFGTSLANLIKIALSEGQGGRETKTQNQKKDKEARDKGRSRFGEAATRD